MTNIINKYEKEQIEKLTSNKRIPAFRPGDTMKVTLKIVEGERSRLQAFEGVCIARKNNGINSNFTVRKLSHGEGVERVFPLFSPLIDKIEIIRKGDVRRAKLYYLRERKGKRARIVDSNRGDEVDQYELVETVSETPKDKVEPAAETKPAEETPKESISDEKKTESSNIEKENSDNEKNK